MSTRNRKKARRQGSFLLPTIMCEGVNKEISRSFSGSDSLSGSLFYAQNTRGKISFRKFGKVTKKRLTNHRKFL